MVSFFRYCLYLFVWLCCACGVRERVKQHVSPALSAPTKGQTEHGHSDASTDSVLRDRIAQIERMTLLQNIREHFTYKNFRSLSAKIRADYNDANGKEFHFNIFLRMKEDRLRGGR